MNRLPYETHGGNLSSADTYKQLLEHLRLAEEAARGLSNLRQSRSDITNAKRWSAFADIFNKIQDIIRVLATGKAETSVGYTGNA